MLSYSLRIRSVTVTDIAEIPLGDNLPETLLVIQYDGRHTPLERPPPVLWPFARDCHLVGSDQTSLDILSYRGSIARSRLFSPGQCVYIDSRHSARLNGVVNTTDTSNVDPRIL